MLIIGIRYRKRTRSQQTVEIAVASECRIAMRVFDDRVPERTMYEFKAKSYISPM